MTGLKTGFDVDDVQRRADMVIQRTIELSEIPAPTGEELDRARCAKRWWNDDDVKDIFLDEVGNLWGCAVVGDGPALLVGAHLDTVFSREVAHGAHRDGTRLSGPGVADDSVAVAALSVLGQMLVDSQLRRPVWLIATVGEEGLGNLRGANWALENAPTSIDAFIALEGNYLGRIGAIAVGSVRWNVDVTGPGGHAWEAASAPSAVDVAARIVASLGDVIVEAGQRSVNVGTFSGGEAVNARALRARFVVDMRAADPAGLERLEAECRELVMAPQVDGVEVVINEIGRRPAGSIDAHHPLVRVARASLERHGVTAEIIASSTDANAAHLAATRGGAGHHLRCG